MKSPLTTSSTHQSSSGICLNMIVKDEQAVIERLLRSVSPFIDSYLIVDTGSSDDTADIIHRVMTEQAQVRHFCDHFLAWLALDCQKLKGLRDCEA